MSSTGGEVQSGVSFLIPDVDPGSPFDQMMGTLGVVVPGGQEEGRVPLLVQGVDVYPLPCQISHHTSMASSGSPEQRRVSCKSLSLHLFN